MTEAELFDALDGMHAYDGGATDSGMHDEDLRQRVKNYLSNLPRDKALVLLSRFVRDHYLTEEAIAQGYGIQDVSNFIQWIRGDMDYWGLW